MKKEGISFWWIVLGILIVVIYGVVGLLFVAVIWIILMMAELEKRVETLEKRRRRK